MVQPSGEGSPQSPSSRPRGDTLGAMPPAVLAQVGSQSHVISCASKCTPCPQTRENKSNPPMFEVFATLTMRLRWQLGQQPPFEDRLWAQQGG